MTAPLRVGVIGAGAIAQVAHLPVLSRLKEVQLVGICDNDLAKAQAVAARFQVEAVYDDIEDLLADARPAAVAVCTPNHLHEIHVHTAVSAGVHVLCERPLALSAAGVEHIVAVQRRSDRAVVVGLNHRFRTDVQALRSFLKTGELGAVQAIRCGWYMFRPSGQIAGWRQQRARSGGGAVLDLGLSLVDLALWLSGCPTPRSVHAVLIRDEGAEVEDAGCALITCENGLSMFVDVSRRYVGDREHFWFDLTGSRGSAGIQPLRIFKEMHGTPVNVAPSGASGREDMFTASYRAEWAHFLAIVRGQVPRPELTDQLILHRTLEAIYRSAAEAKDVSL